MIDFSHKTDISSIIIVPGGHTGPPLQLFSENVFALFLQAETVVIKTNVELFAGAGFAGRPSGYRFAPVAVVCRLSAQAQPACQPRTLGDTACKNAPP